MIIIILEILETEKGCMMKGIQITIKDIMNKKEFIILKKKKICKEWNKWEMKKKRKRKKKKKKKEVIKEKKEKKKIVLPWEGMTKQEWKKKVKEDNRERRANKKFSKKEKQKLIKEQQHNICVK